MGDCILETPRLLLRPFVEADGADLFDYARDLRVGPIAGWPPHQSVEESREIIQTVFSLPGIFAMVLKENGKAVGSIGFVNHHPAGEGCPDDELGYGLHPDYWGRGLMPEAAEAVLNWGFTQRDFARIWCGHYAGNWRSDRVIQKCGFRYQFSRVEFVEDMKENRMTYYDLLTKENWLGRVSGTLCRGGERIY
ncbi:MAG: GNAT family N-acetyltransferase [Oscillibacter sp.]